MAERLAAGPSLAAANCQGATGDAPAVTAGLAVPGAAQMRLLGKRLARLLRAGPQVLATGGGAFMVPETRDCIRHTGISVWLKAELALLLRRVLRRNNRPLLAKDPEGAMRQLMETRYPVYAKADITVESHDLPHDAIVAEIIAALARSPLLSAEAKAASDETASITCDPKHVASPR